MPLIFDKGNADINKFVNELMAVKANDHILEIGFGTGKLINTMAKQINNGLIEGVDFSETMVSVARRRNKKYIAQDKVKIVKGNFDEMSFGKDSFNKVCTVNTIYFWPEPEKTTHKVARLLKPEGQFIIAFEDMAQLNQKPLNRKVFRVYSKNDVRNLLINYGFSNVSIKSREKGSSLLHCAVASK
jgi:ubiquinone/menaquinone biosynthesis C-methylase UbiE